MAVVKPGNDGAVLTTVDFFCGARGWMKDVGYAREPFGDDAVGGENGDLRWNWRGSAFGIVIAGMKPAEIFAAFILEADRVPESGLGAGAVLGNPTEERTVAVEDGNVAVRLEAVGRSGSERGEGERVERGALERESVGKRER